MNIRIRAWDEKNKKMVYDVGSFPYQTHVTPAGTIYVIDNKGFELPLMLSTGKLDRDGEEIYEGDIMGGKRLTSSFVYPNMAISWDDSAMTWKTTNGKKTRTNSTWLATKVMGNIYQNPELAKA
jgi:uncharacterized phage protein (TIGR01671 family)